MQNVNFNRIGKILVVDDKIKDVESLIHELIERGFTVEYWDGNGSSDFISNVRILVLDLDLSGGLLPKQENLQITTSILCKIHGPCVVVIYAREFEPNDITEITSRYKENCNRPIEGLMKIIGYRKNIDVEDMSNRISGIVEDEEIFQLILLWEKILEKAKDLGLSKFVRKKFKNEITVFINDIATDVGEKSLPREFITNMMRFILRYSLRDGEEFNMFVNLLKKINKEYEDGGKRQSEQISDQLLQNRNMYFHPGKEEETWTGDIFKQKNHETATYDYSIVLTPECYIARDKTHTLLMCQGFSLDHASLSNEDHPLRKILKKFELPNEEKAIKNKLKELTNQHDRLFPLWNFSEKDNKYLGICFDFQRVNSIPKEDFEKREHEKISRLDTPYITELMQKYATYSTRVGVPNMNKRPHVNLDQKDES